MITLPPGRSRHALGFVWLIILVPFSFHIWAVDWRSWPPLAVLFGAHSMQAQMVLGAEVGDSTPTFSADNIISDAKRFFALPIGAKKAKFLVCHLAEFGMPRVGLGHTTAHFDGMM
jgi:hypothetical protein